MTRIHRITLPVVLAALAVLSPVALGWTQDIVPPSAASGAGDAAVADPQTDPPAPLKGYESPAATIETFLDATDPEATGGREAALAAFGQDALSGTAAVRTQTLAAFRRLLARLGWDDAAATALLPSGDGADGDSVVLFPWTTTRSGPIAQTSDALAAILQTDWTIELARGADGGWRFTPGSVDPAGLDAAATAFNRLRRERGDSAVETGSIEEWSELNLPEWAIERFLGVAIWQWIGLAGVVFLGLLVDLLTRIVALRFVRGVAVRLHGGVQELAVRRTVRGIGIVAATLVWVTLLSLLGLPLQVYGILEPAAQFALVLAIFWLGWRATDLVGEIIGARAKETDTKLDDIIVPMVRKTAKVLLVVFAMLNLAPMLGLNLGPLLAAIGVGSFGFAFAFKNSLENLFGSVTVILDRPFNVGDWVVVEGVEGTVEAVGLRSTRIRTFYNSLVTMPNANLVTSKVDNYGMRKYRRWKTSIGILYGTPVARIDAFCEGIRELVREHPYTRKDYYQVWLNEFGASGMQVLVYVFWEAPDWQTELRERHRLMLDIIRIAERVGVDFAFPSQTVYLQKGSPPATPTDPRLDEADPRSALKGGREAVRAMVEDAAWREERPPAYRFMSAEETARLDAVADEDRAAEMERRLSKREQAGLPAQSGDDPDRPDFTEQRDAGG